MAENHRVTLDPWRRDVAQFVTAHLPVMPAHVLEVGCGDGWLCHLLADATYDARGIDPQAPDDPLLESVALEEFDHPGTFDAVVATLSLHHIHDINHATNKIADMLAPSGRVIVVEFAWDRFDDRTARWCLERLPARPDDDNWLHHRCLQIRERQLHGEPLGAADVFHRWAADEGFHSSSEMLAALRGRFADDVVEWGPYLYPDLEDVTADQERAAIGSHDIAPVSFRFVGFVRDDAHATPAAVEC